MNTKLLLLPLALSLTACDTHRAPVPSNSPASASTSKVAPPTASTSNMVPATPNQTTALPPTKSLKALSTSTNALASDLWGAIRDSKGNLAVSPASIMTALAMTLGGAKGDTAAEMKRAMHITGSSDEMIATSGQLLRVWNESNGAITLRVANRLFGEKTYVFEQPYIDKTKLVFGAPLEPVDFVKGAEGARILINGWVAKETQERVKDLIPPKAIDDQTRLALVNAMYFKAEWEDPFQERLTKPAPFAVTTSANKDVPTMQQTGHFRYAAQDGVKLLEMPYKNGEASMVFVLPDAVDGLDAVEKSMTPKMLEGWMSSLKHDRVAVSLPRFEINPQGSIALKDALDKLGVKLAFDRHRADFRGIGNPPNPDDRLVISNVFHKAFVKLDEKGTEAAAATAVVMARAGGAPPKDLPKEFKADHPFLFLLRDGRSGMILFMGRVADPTTK